MNRFIVIEEAITDHAARLDALEMAVGALADAVRDAINEDIRRRTGLIGYGTAAGIGR